MKIAIIICMHGKLAKEYINTIKLIIGKPSNTKTINFLPNENVENLLMKFKKSINKLNIKNGIIFLVDIIGGSPFNAANRFIIQNKIKNQIISGTNIPMMIELFLSKNEKNINKLKKIAINSGIEGIK